MFSRETDDLDMTSDAERLSTILGEQIRCAEAMLETLASENRALTEENHQRFQREGVSWTQRVPISAPPKHVKSVLYQYAGDLVGSAVFEFKRDK